MKKEYFFPLRLKDRSVITVYEILDNEEQAIDLCKKLMTHYNAYMGAYHTPSDYQSTIGFLNVMRSDGFDGSFRMSPI